jgi:hypothetical protein
VLEKWLRSFGRTGVVALTAWDKFRREKGKRAQSEGRKRRIFSGARKLRKDDGRFGRNSEGKSMTEMGWNAFFGGE